MEMTASLKSALSSVFSDRTQKLIVDLSRLINHQKSHPQKSINLKILVAGLFRVPNHDPLTLIIIMRPVASLTRS